MDLLPLLTVGSPVGVAAFVIGFLLKQYFEKKKDDREDTKSSRDSETQIVETTKSAIAMVRAEMESLGLTLLEAREERDEYLKKLKAERDRANVLEEERDNLQDEVRMLRRKIVMLEGN